MAPRSGCHEARDERDGAAQVGSTRSNADRGGSLARRKIESSCGCARASKNVRQKLDVRVLAPSKRHAKARRKAARVGRGQGLASWECLARTKIEREPRLAKRDLRRTREA
jgi:hypothetical protein